MKLQLIILLCLTSLATNGQTLPKRGAALRLHFLADGKVDSVPYARIHNKQNSDNANISINGISNKQQDSLKNAALSHLSKRLAATISILKDKDLGYDVFYQAMWGSSDFEELMAELNDLLRYAKGKPYTMACAQYRFTPTPCELNDILDDRTSKLHAEYLPHTHDSAYKAVLYADDLYKKYLVERFNKDFPLSAIYSWKYPETNLTIERQWDGLKELQERANGYSTVFNKWQKDSIITKKFLEVLDSVFLFENNDIANNALITALKRDDGNYLKRWLWFTYGTFSLNPFADTVTINWPIKTDRTTDEKVDVVSKMVKAKIKMIEDGKCCDTSLSYLTALADMDKQLITEKMPKRIAKTESYKSMGVAEVQHEYKVENEVLLPVTRSNIKGLPTWLNSYDAGKKYKKQYFYKSNNVHLLGLRIGTRKKIKKLNRQDITPSNQPIDYLVHNVPENTQLYAGQTATPIPDVSGFQGALNNLTNNVDLTSLVTSFAGANLPTNNGWVGPIVKNIWSTTSIRKSLTTTADTSKSSANPATKSKVPIKPQTPKFVYHCLNGDTIEIKQVPQLNNADKIHFLEKYYASTCMERPHFKNLITSYVDEIGYNIEIHATDTATLRRDLDDFVADFIHELEYIERSKETIAKENILLSHLLAASTPDGILVTLPPVELRADTNRQATYRTVINTPKSLEDSANKITYTIKEVKPKTQLANTSKDISAKPALDTNTVVIENFTTGKKYLLQLAGGFAMTNMPYPYASQPNVKTASLTNGQLNVNVDQQKTSFILGVNLYPWKLFLQDNSFMGIKNHMLVNRLSIFAGVGFPNPLKHYYAGVGIDLVPGLKAIGGAQLITYNSYQLVDNQVSQTATSLRVFGPFAAIAIDPTTLVKYFGLLK